MSIQSSMDWLKKVDIRDMVDYASPLRQGNVEKMPMGALPVVDATVPLLVSTVEGSRVVGGYDHHRAMIETFTVSKKVKVKYDQLDRLSFMADLGAEFAEYEVNEVLRRMHNTEDVVFAELGEIASLRKLFKGLGKNVAVLPNGELAEMGKSFSLWVRSDVSMEVFDEPSTKSMILAIWENIGFSCKIG